MHPLGRLITERMELNGLSLVQVVAIAKGRGATLGKSNLGKLKNEMTPSITRAAIEGMAAGLGVTQLTIANAVLESWGIDPRPVEVTDSAETIRIDPTLDERQKAELMALIREMRNRSIRGGSRPVDEVQDRPGSLGPWIGEPPSNNPTVVRDEDGDERDHRRGG